MSAAMESPVTATQPHPRLRPEQRFPVEQTQLQARSLRVRRLALAGSAHIWTTKSHVLATIDHVCTPCDTTKNVPSHASVRGGGVSSRLPLARLRARGSGGEGRFLLVAVAP